ncbi:MAG: hypothetical protein ACXAAH_17045 [Promethearchaeota archaeon]|jgi:hypothetical protein
MKRKSIDKVSGFDNIPPEYEHYYVVLRSGRRVSPSNHHTSNEAHMEKEYWVNILRKWPDGTKMEIVECKNPNFKKK